MSLMASRALAQTSETYIYPGTNFNTEFAIGNINDQAVGVSVIFYSGSTGESVTDSFVLNPGTQTRFIPEDVDPGLATFGGSTVVVADLPVAITASIYEPLSSFDSMLPAEPAVELVLPLSSLGSGFTQVAIFNPGDENAAARLIVVSESGEAITFNDRTIEPKRTVLINVGAQAGMQGDAAYVVVRTSNFFLGGRPVAATTFLREFNPADGMSVIRNDVAFVAGRPLSQEPTTTRLPLFRQGAADFMSIVQVINDSTSPQTVTLTALGVDGQVIPGSNNPATVSLAGRAAHTESVETLFDISTTQLQEGMILIDGQARVSASVGIGGITDPGLVVIPADDALVQDFAYQTRQVGREFYFLPSLGNTSAQTANLNLTFIQDDGTVVSTITQTLAPNEQLITTLADLFPEAQGNGFVLIHSDTPLVVTGVESEDDNAAAGIWRTQPASPNFMPGTPTEVFAVGTVRSNGIGLPNVTVTLTGTQAGTTLTDGAGTYIFDNLPAGSYTLTAQAIGYTLTPSQLNFSISNASSRDNDFTAALIAPAITSYSPTAAPAGSAATMVTIDGGPFIAGSVVMFGTSQLATTVVNSQQLEATIPANQLQSPIQQNLFVRNIGVAGGTADSAPVVFTVGNPPPTLLALSGQPNPLIAGATGFTLTLTGSGFLPGATVSVNSVSRPATFVSDTQLQTAISTAELVTGGFLPVFVLNPGPAVPSNSIDLVVENPPPNITAISPSTTQVLLDPNLPPMPLTVSGSGFQDGAAVIVDGTMVPTQFVNATSVIGSVPASLLGLSGIHDVQVTNPAPSTGPSFATPLTLTNPVPILTSVTGTLVFDPSQAGQEQTAPVLLNGNDFAENSTAWVSLVCDGLGFRKLPNVTVPSGGTLPVQYETRRLSPGTIAATVNLECSGDYIFQVRSPQPGGGSSATVTVTVP